MLAAAIVDATVWVFPVVVGHKATELVGEVRFELCAQFVSSADHITQWSGAASLRILVD